MDPYEADLRQHDRDALALFVPLGGTGYAAVNLPRVAG